MSTAMENRGREPNSPIGYDIYRQFNQSQILPGVKRLGMRECKNNSSTGK